VNTVTKRLRAAALTIGIAFGLLLGSTQAIAAIPVPNGNPIPGNRYPYYNHYYNSYLAWWAQWNKFHLRCPYYYNALKYLYAYYAGVYGDYEGWKNDPQGKKSDKRINNNYYSPSTAHDTVYNRYMYLSDKYWWTCH